MQLLVDKKINLDRIKNEKKIKLDKYEKELDLHLEHCHRIDNERTIKKQLEIAAKKYLTDKKRITI